MHIHTYHTYIHIYYVVVPHLLCRFSRANVRRLAPLELLRLDLLRVLADLRNRQPDIPSDRRRGARVKHVLTREELKKRNC